MKIAVRSDDDRVGMPDQWGGYAQAIGSLCPGGRAAVTDYQMIHALERSLKDPSRVAQRSLNDRSTFPKREDGGRPPGAGSLHEGGWGVGVSKLPFHEKFSRFTEPGLLLARHPLVHQGVKKSSVLTDLRQVFASGSISVLRNAAK